MFKEVEVPEETYELIKKGALKEGKTITVYINDKVRAHLEKLKLEELKKKEFLNDERNRSD